MVVYQWETRRKGKYTVDGYNLKITYWQGWFLLGFIPVLIKPFCVKKFV